MSAKAIQLALMLISIQNDFYVMDEWEYKTSCAAKTLVFILREPVKICQPILSPQS